MLGGALAIVEDIVEPDDQDNEVVVVDTAAVGAAAIAAATVFCFPVRHG